VATWQEVRPGLWECWDLWLMEIVDVPGGIFTVHAQGRGIVAQGETLRAAQRKAERWARAELRWEKRRREAGEALARELGLPPLPPG